MANHLHSRCPHDGPGCRDGPRPGGMEGRQDRGPASWASGRALYVILALGMGQVKGHENSNSDGRSLLPVTPDRPPCLTEPSLLPVQIITTPTPQDRRGQGTRATLQARHRQPEAASLVRSPRVSPLPAPSVPSAPWLSPTASVAQGRPGAGFGK